MSNAIPTASADLLTELEKAWDRSDRIFAMVRRESLMERPIALRHPWLFYIGHLPAFAWNMIGRDVLGRPSARPDYDRLFDFGIDPDDDEVVTTPEWPSLKDVLAYRDGVRDDVRRSVSELAAMDDHPLAEHGRVLHLVLEHELMHHETLLYMLQELDIAHKVIDGDWKKPTLGDARAEPRWLGVPGGQVPLGLDRQSVDFVWDNESPARVAEVADFEISSLPVTVAEFEAFVNEGGYEVRELWDEADWAWRTQHDLQHPKDWQVRHGRRFVRTLFDRVPLEEVGGWPVCTSLAEARAFARWKDARLPSEAELLRAAFGDDESSYPWGDADAAPPHANVDFAHGSPSPVGTYPLGASPYGLQDFVGNGWEWTSTPFETHAGFEAWVPGYQGYSRDFFDGKHYVLLGGSWATDAKLARRTFRNWFRENYPYPFTQFRLARG